MEEASLSSGVSRIKFKTVRLGTTDDFLASADDSLFCKDYILNQSKEMGYALRKLEDIGAAPLCADGAVAGNAAAIIPGVDAILVSKSGKNSGTFDPENDVAVVTNFSEDGWFAEYYSPSEDVKPTSDTPLHWATLVKSKHAVQSAASFGSNSMHSCFKAFTACPAVTLHGHALQTEQEAEALALPISHEETMFSTPDDTNALVRLFKDFPYPSSKVYIRKGHGFLVMDHSFSAALLTFMVKWDSLYQKY